MKNNRKRTVVQSILVLTLALCAGCMNGPPPPPDAIAATLILQGGRIWTGDPDIPEASAVAIRDHRIVAVGNDEEILACAGRQTRVIDLDGRRVVPGFIDDHVHFLPPVDEELLDPHLASAGSEEEFARRVGEACAELAKGEWLHIGGWTQDLGGQLPTKKLINPYTPDNPVFLIGGHGHMALVNSLALEMAGISEETEDPPGGTIVRFPGTREPTGVLKNKAMDLVRAHMEKRKPSLEYQYAKALEKLKYAASLGVTGVVENLDDVSSLEVYNELLANGELTLRAHVYALIEHLDSWVSSGIRTGTGNRFIRFCGLKSQVDGALGASTAYFFEPYSDSPGNRGLLLEDLSPGGSLERRIDRSVEAGIQTMTHALGDRAIQEVLDIFERVGGDQSARYRFRIEHAQHPRPDDIKRFGELGVIASVQPYSAIDDGQWVEKRLGDERSATTYPFRDFLDGGAVLAFGSDGLGESFSPLVGIYAAVTRATLDGKHPDGWFPGQKITVEEALRAYTFGSAYASFFEDQAGSLTPGRLADLVVLDTDILSVEPEQIRDAGVLLTIVDGKKVWMAPEAPWAWPETDP